VWLYAARKEQHDSQHWRYCCTQPLLLLPLLLPLLLLLLLLLLPLLLLLLLRFLDTTTGADTVRHC
jgi:hypothetical protein